MKQQLFLVALLLLAKPPAQCAEPVAKQFLQYIYGADGITLSNICHPSDDLWMLRGAKNAKALAALNTEKIEAKKAGVISGVLGTDLYFIETREGLIAPAFNLEGIFALHRQLVAHFIFAALAQDQKLLGRLTTDSTKVQIVGKKAAPGDMDQYASIIESMPIVRSSKAADDAKTKTITYRVPLGETGMTLTLKKQDSTWLIDTSKSVRVPLEFFFQ